jgi:hypothetical protein
MSGSTTRPRSRSPRHAAGQSAPTRPPRPSRYRGFLDLSDVSTVVFRVPDNTTAGTLTFDLRKSRLVDDHRKTFSWARPPRLFTLKLAFTP